MFLSFADTAVEFPLDRATCYLENLPRSSHFEVYSVLTVWITQRVTTNTLGFEMEFINTQ